MNLEEQYNKEIKAKIINNSDNILEELFSWYSPLQLKDSIENLMYKYSDMIMSDDCFIGHKRSEASCELHVLKFLKDLLTSPEYLETEKQTK